jgi:hypothetical protein
MKQTLCWLLLTFICSGWLDAQTEKKLNLGFHGSINLVQELGINEDLIEPGNAVGLSFGLDIHFYPDKPVSLLTGINYRFLQVKRTDYSITFGSDFTGSGFDYYASWLESTLQGHYLGIPLAARIHLFGEKNQFYFKAGFEPTFKMLQTSRQYLVEHRMPKSKTQLPGWGDLDSVLILAQAGFGYEVILKKGYQLFIGPGVALTLNEFLSNSNADNNGSLLLTELQIGLRF